jgi:hypothetical protein
MHKFPFCDDREYENVFQILMKYDIIKINREEVIKWTCCRQEKSI